MTVINFEDGVPSFNLVIPRVNQVIRVFPGLKWPGYMPVGNGYAITGVRGDGRGLGNELN